MKLNKLEEVLLETFSFYTPLIQEHAILQIKDESMDSISSFSMIDFKNACKNLERKGLLKRVKVGEDIAWIRIFPPKTMSKKFFRFLRSFF